MKLFLRLIILSLLLFPAITISLNSMVSSAWGSDGGGGDGGDGGGDGGDGGGGGDGGDGGGDGGDGGGDGGDGGGDGGDGGGDGGDGGGGDGSDGGSSGSGGSSGGGSGNSGGSHTGRNDDDEDVDEDKVTRSRNFKSLSGIIRQFNRSRKGRFLDVNITRKKGIYYYKITYIRTDGKVAKVLYRARKKSGRQKKNRSRQNFNKSQN